MADETAPVLATAQDGVPQAQQVATSEPVVVTHADTPPTVLVGNDSEPVTSSAPTITTQAPSSPPRDEQNQVGTDSVAGARNVTSPVDAATETTTAVDTAATTTTVNTQAAATRVHTLTPLTIPVTSTATTSTSPTVSSPLKRRLSFSDDVKPTAATELAVPSTIAPAAKPVDQYDDPTSAVSRAAQNASDWNRLLGWVRDARGPQWDYATASYHVKRGSHEYFSGVTKLEGSEAALAGSISTTGFTPQAGAVFGPSASSFANADAPTESRRARRARIR
ncbi:hypothetical protein OIO90_002919 [Microbotryomycetes sp. JL221]|nr:hypothetical protein OIO90_002919 [Microbotryomycetes sp. JL221]